jgi:hypothetical protein
MEFGLSSLLFSSIVTAMEESFVCRGSYTPPVSHGYHRYPWTGLFVLSRVEEVRKHFLAGYSRTLRRVIPRLIDDFSSESPISSAWEVYTISVTQLPDGHGARKAELW